MSTADGMMPISQDFHRSRPWSVRASFGTAGTHSGLKMLSNIKSVRVNA